MRFARSDRSRTGRPGGGSRRGGGPFGCRSAQARPVDVSARARSRAAPSCRAERRGVRQRADACAAAADRRRDPWKIIDRPAHSRYLRASQRASPVGGAVEYLRRGSSAGAALSRLGAASARVDRAKRSRPIGAGSASVHTISDDIEAVRRRRAQLCERRYKASVPRGAGRLYQCRQTTLFNL